MSVSYLKRFKMEFRRFSLMGNVFMQITSPNSMCSPANVYKSVYSI